MMKKGIAIIGLGLMGGSLALCLKEKMPGLKIIGIDKSSLTVEKALEMKVINKGTTDLAEGLKEVDLVFLALPQEESLALASALKEHLPKGALVTDMASTKAGITSEMEKILAPEVKFLGGHPMTGSERQGIEAADPFLFENAAYVLTPTQTTSTTSLEKVSSLVKKLGAEVIILSPLKHDRIVAAISHLPHLAAAALVNSTAQGEDRELALALAAGSFRDGTRVAVSSPEMWRDICLDNREALLSYLSSYQRELERVEKAIRLREGEGLKQFFSEAREVRQKLPPRGKGFLTPLYDVVVLVEDTPGIIGDMAVLLGKATINIAEIEVMRVREDEEGSIRFAFKDLRERERALELLKGAGIKAWNRG